jgi:hypothetical protein
MAYTWAICSVRVQDGVGEDAKALLEYLEDGWEPFAVTGIQGDLTYHLKKSRS